MNEIDAWIDLDGPEPEQVRPLLDALHEVPPVTPEAKERVARRLRERVKAELARRREVSVATGSTPARVKGEGKVGEESPTVRSPTFDERTAPTAPAEPPAPSRTVEAREARPAERPPQENLTITSPMLEVPAEFRKPSRDLPFRPRVPAPELTRTDKVPVMNWRQGATAPLGDDALTKAVAALPFVVKPARAEAVPFPRLTLEEYASLRAELSVWPERRAAILPRYHVANEAALRELDEHWGVETAVSSETWLRFEKAFREFRAWLQTQGG